jgi:hypothetical protein
MIMRGVHAGQSVQPDSLTAPTGNCQKSDPPSVALSENCHCRTSLCPPKRNGLAEATGAIRDERHSALEVQTCHI